MKSYKKSYNERVAEIAERDAEIRAEMRLVSGDARLDDTGMTQDDYAEIYARNPEMIDY